VAAGELRAETSKGWHEADEEVARPPPAAAEEEEGKSVPPPEPVSFVETENGGPVSADAGSSAFPSVVLPSASEAAVSFSPRCGSVGLGDRRGRGVLAPPSLSRELERGPEGCVGETDARDKAARPAVSPLSPPEP